ncbi:tRNA-ribosyltransferase [Caldivirga sp.]|uniref:tRNA-ribosyltransferase n=1 Tax=Caldivirga sp. TaxID=2080243 RepID=UPI003D0D5F0C
MKVLLGTPPRATPRPWIDFTGIINVPVIVSAFELLKMRSPGDAPLHSLLQHSGEIWVDSGGYQFLSRGIEISIDDVAKVYSRFWDASTYLALDYPPLPSDDSNVAFNKFRKTIEAYDALSKALEKESIEVMPVIHYYRDEKIVLEALENIIDHNPKEIAIGGLVPYVLVTRNVPKNSRWRALLFIAKVMREFNGKIHVLGLGSPSITPTLELLGVYSTDSSTWRIKAAYGKVMLPGGGERHVTGRRVNFGKRTIKEDELEELYAFLRETKFPLLGNYPDGLYSSFEYRALVNAWVTLMNNGKPRGSSFRLMYERIRALMEQADA